MGRISVPRLLGFAMVSAVMLAGTVACGGKTAATSSSDPNTKAVDDYCALVKEAMTATKSKDPEQIKAIVPKLQAAYPGALAATKKDPKLVKRFADCAKGNG